MIERLAIPARDTGPTPLTAWVERLQERSGSPVVVARDGPEASWIEIGSLRLRGYAVLAGPDVEAINFEINAPDPEPTHRFLEDVAASIGWEIHIDDEDD